MLNSKPKMIMFDVGGTLFNDGKFNAQDGFEKLRLSATNPEITSSAALAECWDEYIGDINKEFENLEIPLFAALKYTAMKTGLHIDLPTFKQEEIFDRFNSSRYVIDGVNELLQTIKFSGIRTAVISNNMMSGESLYESLRYWIPEAEFEFCLSSADLLIKKPDNRIFEVALNYASVDACDCVYCGDGFIPDVCGSLSCGMNAVLIDKNAEKDFEIRTHEGKEYIAVNNWFAFADYLKSL